MKQLICIVSVLLMASCTVKTGKFIEDNIDPSSENDSSDTVGDTCKDSGQSFSVSGMTLTQAVEARELFTAIGTKDVIAKIDTRILALVQEAIDAASRVDDPEIVGEGYFSTKDSLQTFISICGYGNITVDRFLLTNKSLNELTETKLKKLGHDELDSLRTDLSDAETAINAIKRFREVDSALKDEQLDNLQEKIGAVISTDFSKIAVYDYWKESFICSFCQFLDKFSGCSSQKELSALCKKALSGDLYKEKIETIKTKTLPDIQKAMEERPKTVDAELLSAIDAAKAAAALAEKQCKESGGAICDQIDALKNAIEQANKTYEIFKKDAKSYLAENDTVFKALLTEYNEATATMDRMASPCSDPEGGDGK